MTPIFPIIAEFLTLAGALVAVIASIAKSISFRSGKKHLLEISKTNVAINREFSQAMSDKVLDNREKAKLVAMFVEHLQSVNDAHKNLYRLKSVSKLSNWSHHYNHSMSEKLVRRSLMQKNARFLYDLAEQALDKAKKVRLFQL
jgi:hypothetical protein